MNKIDISLSTILKFFAVLVGIIFLYYIRDILVILFIVAVIVAALGPMVDWAEKYKMPRVFSTIFIYLVLLSFFSLVIYLIVPPLVAQLTTLSHNLPIYINKIAPYYYQLNVSVSIYDWQEILNSFSQELGALSKNIYTVGLVIFGGVATSVTIFILSFYLLVERASLNKYFSKLYSIFNKSNTLAIVAKFNQKIGGWLRGQVVISLSMGLLTMLSLSIIGIPYALTIGVIAALLEVVPIIGPVITGTLAVLIALMTVGWVKALIAVAVYILLQQLESQFLVPKIMGKAVGLSPVIILVSLLIGAKLGGIVGAIIAIPLAAGISVFIEDYRAKKK